MSTAASDPAAADLSWPRTLWAAAAARALRDGCPDTICVLLPVWQAEFGIGDGLLAPLRGLYAGPAQPAE